MPFQLRGLGNPGPQSLDKLQKSWNPAPQNLVSLNPGNLDPKILISCETQDIKIWEPRETQETQET